MVWRRPETPVEEHFPSVWVIADGDDGRIVALERTEGGWTLPWADYYEGFYSWPEMAVGNALMRHLELTANFTGRAVLLGSGAVVVGGREVGNRLFYGVRLSPEELLHVDIVERAALLELAEIEALAEQNPDLRFARQFIPDKRIQ